MGTDDIGDFCITVTVEVDQRPLREALVRLRRRGSVSRELIKELSCISSAGGDGLIDLEFGPEPRRAACRVTMRPGKRLLELLREEDGGG